MRYLRDYILYLAGAFGSMIAGMWLSTQEIARLLNHPVEFGDPYIIFGRPVYPPYFLIWWHNYGDYAPEQFEDAATYCIIGIFVALCFVFVFAFARVMRKPQLSSHGSARWANQKEIEETGLLDGNGFVLGTTEEGEYLSHDSNEHDMLIAPTGSGKGISSVLPTLMSEAWPHSCVVLDVKKENWNATSRFRKETLGQLVIKFEPLIDDGTSACFNVLDEIRLKTAFEADDVQTICQILIPSDTKGDPHWPISAAAFLVGVMLHVKYLHEDASLPLIGSYLKIKPLGELLMEMLEAEHVEDEDFFRNLYGYCIEETPKTHPIVYQAAMKMANTPEKERGSIYSATIPPFALFDNPVISKNVRYSSFRIADLMDYEKPVTLFLVTPPGEIKKLKNIFRVMVEMMLNKLTGPLSEKKEHDHKHRLMFLLDEFPALERMEKIESALAWARGYKIKFSLVIQNIPQITQFYTQNTSIFGNCKVRIYHAPADPDTKNALSKELGNKTIIVENKSYQRNFRIPLLKSETISTQEIAKPLLDPTEVGLLGDNLVILMTGKRPILGRKIKYFEDPVFAQNELPPLETSDIIYPPPPQVASRPVSSTSSFIEKEREEEEKEGKAAPRIEDDYYAAADDFEFDDS